MSRITWIVVVSIAVAALLGVVLLCAGPSDEPSYQGRPLHSWLEDIKGLRFRCETGRGLELEVTNVAVSAVLAIGPQALPWLCRELRARESSLKVKIRATISFRYLRPFWSLIGPPDHPTLWERHRRAGVGVLVLGDVALAALPELAANLKSGDDCSLYTWSLVRMGRAGVPVLAASVTNEATRFISLAALEATGASTEPAVPALLNVLTNGNGFPSIQGAFRNARGASNMIVPVLEGVMSSPKFTVAESAKETLKVMRRTSDPEIKFTLDVDRYGNFGAR